MNKETAKAVSPCVNSICEKKNISINIFVATHKRYRMPLDDIYIPIHVGKAGKSLNLGIQTDDTGENISEKNPNFCELTALYWIWKNFESDYVGLAHYRRHFVMKYKKNKWDRLISRSEAEIILKKVDVILPQKRKYYIESNYSHYIHGHKKESLDKAIEILKRDYPQYSEACDIVMKCSWAHMFNMFVMKKDLFNDYCKWLFSILFKLEDELDISSYSVFEARVFGRISELFLDVWIKKNNIDYMEVPVLFMESQSWIHKSLSFIGRKFGFIKKNEKY